MNPKKIKQTSGLGTLLVLLYSFLGVFAIFAILIVTSLVFESGIIELVLFLVLIAVFIAIPFIFTSSRRKAFAKKLEEENFQESFRHVDKGRGLIAIDEAHKKVAFMSYMNPFNIYIFDGSELRDLGSGKFSAMNAAGIGFWFTVNGSKKLFFRTYFKNTTGATTGYLVGDIIGAAVGSAIEKASGGDARYKVFEDEAAEIAEKFAAIGATKEIPAVK